MYFCLYYCSIRFSPKSVPISAKFWCVGDSTTFPCSAYRRACWTCMMQLKKPAASVHFLCLYCGWHKMSAPAGDYTVRLTVSRNTWSNSWRTLTFLVAQRRKKQNRATQASLTGFWSASAGEGWTWSNWCSSENTGKSVLHCHRVFNVNVWPQCVPCCVFLESELLAVALLLHQASKPLVFFPSHIVNN